MGDKNPNKRPEARKRISKTMKRLYREGKIKQWLKGAPKEKHPFYNKHHTEESKEKNSNTCKNSKKFQKAVHSKKRCEKISKSMKGRKCPWLEGDKHPNKRPEARKRIKKLWEDPEYKDKKVKELRKALHIKPNKPEKFLIDLIKRNNLPYEYTGDGKTIINGHNPDFFNNDGVKSVILLDGIYWHLWKKQKDRCDPNLTKEMIEAEERKPYEKSGFHVLHIWEDELKSPEKVLSKILKFTEGAKL